MRARRQEDCFSKTLHQTTCSAHKASPGQLRASSASALRAYRLAQLRTHTPSICMLTSGLWNVRSRAQLARCACKPHPGASSNASVRCSTAVLQSSSNMARLPLRRAASAVSERGELSLGLPPVREAELLAASCAGEAGALAQVLTVYRGHRSSQ